MSSIATTNETSNVTSLPTAPKPQTSKEVIAANVKLLIEQLEAGHSEGLTAYLTAMGKFHNYSFGNILEIARQMPSASRLDAGNAAADYIHLYNGNAALLTESLEVIQRTSALILSAIETPEVMQVPTEKQPPHHPTTPPHTPNTPHPHSPY